MDLTAVPRKAMKWGALFASTALLFTSAFGQSSSLGNGNNLVASNSGGPSITSSVAVKFAQPEADNFKEFLQLLMTIKPDMKDDQVRKLLIDNNYSDGVIMLEVLRDISSPWLKNPGDGERDTRYRFIEIDKGVQKYFHDVRNDPTRFSFGLAMLFYWGRDINPIASSQRVAGFKGGDLASAAAAMFALNFNLDIDTKLPEVVKLTNGYAKNRFANGADDRAIQKFLAIPTLSVREAYLMNSLFPEIKPAIQRNNRPLNGPNN